MTGEALLGDILFSIQDLLYIVYYEKIPSMGHIYLSTTILMFLFELKNMYLLKKLKIELNQLKS